MEASDQLALAVVNRVKREDCKRTTQDSRFSNWKILVGPSDWEDYSLGKDGAERYRVHNLPEMESAGVYELGFPILRTGFGREIGKLDRKYIFAVYCGHSCNVRARLQQYGRSGAHLGNGCLTGHCSDLVQKGPGYFREILKSGRPIVYRWAPMENKSAAVRTESRILSKFDYAWNRSFNGGRRPDDVLQKLPKTMVIANFTHELQPFSQKKVGIKIESRKPHSAEDKSSDRESNNPPLGIFKFGRSQPRLVVDISDITRESTGFCGVAVGHGGSVCRTPPVSGRERCAEHKGMRIGGSVRVGISTSNVGSHCGRNALNATHHPAVEKLPLVKGCVSESFVSICGFILADGSPCTSHPGPRRVRCDEHKGMRIQGSGRVGISSSHVDSHCSRNASNTTHHSAVVKLPRIQPRVSEGFVSICGFILADGSSCTSHPGPGRVRCDEHKGMRIQGSVRVGISSSNADSHCSRNASNTTHHSAMVKLPRIQARVSERSVPICGFILANGSPCTRHPGQARVRCDTHKGRRIRSW